jgi:hypothetical protein
MIRFFVTQRRFPDYRAALEGAALRLGGISNARPQFWLWAGVWHAGAF